MTVQGTVKTLSCRVDKPRSTGVPLPALVINAAAARQSSTEQVADRKTASLLPIRVVKPAAVE